MYLMVGSTITHCPNFHSLGVNLEVGQCWSSGFVLFHYRAGFSEPFDFSCKLQGRLLTFIEELGGVLQGTVLDLFVELGRTRVLAVLNLPIPECEESLLLFRSLISLIGVL